MATVTATTKAWITDISYVSPKDLFEGKLGGLAYSNQNMVTAGWTFVGEATISVDLVGERELVENKVEALKEEAKSIRAEAHMKCTRIEEQIQNLLAITYEPSES